MENDKYKSQADYDKKNGVFRISMKLSPKTEQDIIDQLKSQGVGKQSTYIKKLIREDIARNRK